MTKNIDLFHAILIFLDVPVDLYIKLFKKVETHLNTEYSLRCVRLSQIVSIKTYH